MHKRQLLLATSNPGKEREMRSFLQTLPFEILSLKDISYSQEEPVENQSTIEGNALVKARWYAEKTGILSLADDGGLFIDVLDGWPGVTSARIGKTSKERNDLILDRLKEIKDPMMREAVFRSVLALYDPEAMVVFSALGETRGRILDKSVIKDNGFSYDPIFFVPEAKKTYAEMTVAEKNGISHRGKALVKIKYHLQKTYGVQHIVVPFALIIREKKVLMILRHDPHRPEYHKKWEFPGGGVEFGETVIQNLVREVKEETGLEVEPFRLLQYIAVESQNYPTFSYQVYLLPYLCRILGGVEQPAEEEAAEIRWFDLDEVLAYDLLGENKKMYQELLPELKQIVTSNE